MSVFDQNNETSEQDYVTLDGGAAMPIGKTVTIIDTSPTTQAMIREINGGREPQTIEDAIREMNGGRDPRSLREMVTSNSPPLNEAEQHVLNTPELLKLAIEIQEARKMEMMVCTFLPVPEGGMRMGEETTMRLERELEAKLKEAGFDLDSLPDVDAIVENASPEQLVQARALGEDAKKEAGPVVWGREGSHTWDLGGDLGKPEAPSVKDSTELSVLTTFPATKPFAR